MDKVDTMHDFTSLLMVAARSFTALTRRSSLFVEEFRDICVGTQCIAGR